MKRFHCNKHQKDIMPKKCLYRDFSLPSRLYGFFKARREIELEI